MPPSVGGGGSLDLKPRPLLNQESRFQKLEVRRTEGDERIEEPVTLPEDGESPLLCSEVDPPCLVGGKATATRPTGIDWLTCEKTWMVCPRKRKVQEKT